jgi:hypothetical protein
MTGPSLLQAGIYTVPAAAELVQAPQRMVRIWVGGQIGATLVCAGCVGMSLLVANNL